MGRENVQNPEKMCRIHSVHVFNNEHYFFVLMSFFIFGYSLLNDSSYNILT